ncbi:hypothetical protein FKW77_002282 [Venturia effusa]|uniref:Uncharacterized protein n=1 Tax=Venturia effusa TaxID=50376 RepID=A0A517LI96_9PEZI|nr:hypothetical protein FKW77_002282 [Venturia effusa]
MRLLAAVVYLITCVSTVYARPDGSDFSLAKSGPHVESSHSESPSLVTPASPLNPPWNANGAGTTPANASTSPPKGQPSQPSSSNGATPGRVTSGHEGDVGMTTNQLLEPPNQPAAGGSGSGSFGSEEGLMQNHSTGDSKVLPTPSLVPASASTPATSPDIYELPDPNEPQPRIVKGAPPVPMAMVHSEAAMEDGPHTMRPGDSILTSGVDPLASNVVQGMGLATPRPTRVPPVVQGATFAAGGTIYTASIDRDFNVVVASNILKPGGAAATLAGGAAKVSVLPGGALVVDGATITMSALNPPVTGCVVNINGQLVTARETGTDHQVMILSTATLTVGGPAVTLDGQQVSLGPLGLHIGPSSVAAISTMTPPPAITPAPSQPPDILPGIARVTPTSSGGAKPMVTVVPPKTGSGTRQFSLGTNLVMSLGLVFGIFLVAG